MRKINIGIILLSTIIMTACQQQETTQPVRKDIDTAVFASGYVEQENIYTVSAKVEGILTSIPIKEGDEVKKNTLIAKLENDLQSNQLQDAQFVLTDAMEDASIDSPKRQQLEAQIEQATKQLTFDQENYQRYQALWEKKSVSRIEYEKTELQLKASENNLKALQQSYQDLESDLEMHAQRGRVQVSTQQIMLNDYQLTTGASGTVIHIYKKQGELVRRGEAVAQVASGSYVLTLFISEEDITQIKLGQHIAVRVNTYPNTVFPAQVTKILPGFNQMEQSYIIEAQFLQQPEMMFSGTQLQANIETGTKKNVLVIPTEYLTKGNVVHLADGTTRKVVTGLKNNGWTEIIAGLSEAETLYKPQ